MQDDKSKFKEEFNGQVYEFALDVIRFAEQLSEGQISTILTLKSRS